LIDDCQAIDVEWRGANTLLSAPRVVSPDCRIVDNETMMKNLSALRLTVMLSVMLAACMNAPVVQPPTHLFADKLFPPTSERINAADVFAASDRMRSHLKNDVADLLLIKGA